MPLFSKYSGAGNDFVIVRGEELGLRDAGALAAKLCPRATGVGVDGLITVRSLSEELVRLRFFNRDGSEFSTCGNGSRCAARYAVDRGLVPEEHILVTDDGEILARALEDGVALEYALDARVERELRADVGGYERDGWLVRMGTAHLVLPVPSVEVEDFDAVCRPLRWREDLGDGGANVHLVAREDGDTFVRTFERGVEGETRACGSGCMAVAFALRNAGEAAGRFEFVTRSGVVLSVEFLEAGRIRLKGPAAFIFDGVFPEAML
ncbi:diaminopimelate epimerase [Candidatus Palauibacter sp.]|uniref:diaminopimelate epimerase n=1 Tax=Candidatus Palauibacter sp. TaxID=3101350 RepID=UPI003B0165CB